VCRPADESSYIAPKPTPISMIQAIGRGERNLGVKILKETMSFLRCYAERGDLDIDLIGMSLLQQIVNSLNLRNSSWNSDTAELSHHRHIKIRVFNSACWLTTFFIVEFLTLPIVQSYSKFHFKLDAVGGSNGSLNSDQYISGLHSSEPRRLPGSIGGILENSKLDEIKQKLFDDNFIPESHESSSDDDTVHDPGRLSVEIDGSNFQNMRLSSSDVRPRSASFNAAIPSMTRARSNSPMGAMQDEGDTDSFWGLFGSLLSLLESLDRNVAKRGTAGIKIALSAGLRNSQQIMQSGQF
jgi:hypothetical protein